MWRMERCVAIDRDDVRSSCERVVLVRLIEQDLPTLPSEMPRFDFPHHGMDRIGIAGRAAGARRRHRERRCEAEGDRQARVDLERPSLTRLQPMDARVGHPRTSRDLAECPSPSRACLTKLDAKLEGDPVRERVGRGCRGCDLVG